ISEFMNRTRVFIYYVSNTGITGAKLRDRDSIKRNVRAIQKKAGKPVAVGFGIATPDDARQIAAFSDGVIVGSALVRKIEELQHSTDLVTEISRFTAELKAALSDSC
ncbi:MAG: tryptophan synthase subunit alpha, partial [Nitrospira sp. SB0661_bin_20]|nr:tryptophan synthase subunit alpha [Nitrospira sp. SB0661_bin_20]